MNADCHAQLFILSFLTLLPHTFAPQAVSDVLGRAIWKRTILVLTHSNMPQTPPGQDYDK